MNSRRLPAVLATLTVLVASARIAATHTVFTGTYDETVHLTSGIELLSNRTYDYSPTHPPAARLTAALGPWLAGARFPSGESISIPSFVATADSVMLSGSGYRENLRLGRIGILPFFLVTGLFLFLWTRHVAGEPTAAIAVALLCFTPPVLAHSGVVTTDAAAMASFTAMVYAMQRWLEPHDSIQCSIWLGVAAGFAFGSKLSTIPFIGTTTVGLVAAFWITARRSSTPFSLEISFKRLAIAAGTALLTLHALYGFTVAQTLGFPAPLSDFVFGLMLLVRQNMNGMVTYLLGDVYAGGRFLFFPVAIAVKTPIPLLLLATVGIVVSARRWRRGEGVRWLAPAIAFGAPFAVASFSSINLGTRHVLPVYPAMAALGGIGIVALWRVTTATRLVTAALATWMVIGTWRAHPDYLPWFNELAGDEPAAILIGSDLDWGQDLERLADTVRTRGIDSLSIAYYGFPDRLGQLFPNARVIGPGDERPHGWFAVSETLYRRGWTSLPGATFISETDSLDWLKEVEPVTRVGKTIRLYFLSRRTDIAPDDTVVTGPRTVPPPF